MQLKKFTLERWENEFWKVFSKHDLRRSPAEMWLAILQYASQISEGMRKNNYTEVIKGIAHCVCWLSSFVAKCRLDEKLPTVFRIEDCFDDIVAFKYFERCPYCDQAHCICGMNRYKLEIEFDKKFDRIKLEQLLKRRDENKSSYKKHNINYWPDMFKDIYGNTLYSLSPEAICFHFFEEVGEAALFIRKLQECVAVKNVDIKTDTKSLVASYNEQTASNDAVNRYKLYLLLEIADTFSWLCAIFIKIKFLLEGISKYIGKEEHLFLTRILIKTFDPNNKGRVHCPTCARAECNCEFNFL